MRHMEAQVAVALAVYSFDKPYTYNIPLEIQDDIKPGARVIVPFGAGNRKRVGIILSINPREQRPEEQDKDEGRYKIKSILTLIDKEPLLSDEMLDMMYWLKDNTFCTFYDAFKTIIPAGMSVYVKERYSLSKKYSAEGLPEEALSLISLLRNCKVKKEFDSIIDSAMRYGKHDYINRLFDMGILVKHEEYKQKTKNKNIKMLRLSDKYIRGEIHYNITPKQMTVVKLLEENGSASLKEIIYICNITESIIKNMVKNEIAEKYETEILRDAFSYMSDFSTQSADDIILNCEQADAFGKISDQLISGKPKCFLLHGVTGSGKTSVFKKLIAEALRLGRQALMLIPEIALTPQALIQFQSLFGTQVAVIHSSLTLGQKMDEYKRIKNGQAKIAIGTRSAVFAPFDNLGLIIMDEEGERSYKSDASPRYNTADVAKKRCKTHNAVLVLASATPSVESYYYAEKGIYELVEIKSRYKNAPLPEVHIVDMTEERIKGNTSEFSVQLLDEMKYNLEKGQQTILLLNRRGYNSILVCTKCYEPVYCPNCTIPLTYHKSNENMLCHYCGYSAALSNTCKKCGNDRLRAMGFGTQKIEEEIKLFLPNARLLRMDSDTISSRYTYEQNFKAFADGEYDILLGTQMISKGLDFPNVTLVGVISVDKALMSGDFRSYERTFSLITQVVGRGGRGEKKGRAYLQTFQPEHYIIGLAAQQNYRAFYKEEIALRRCLIFPPVCDTCTLMFVHEENEKVCAAADKMLELLKAEVSGGNIKFPLRVLGPAKCPYEKINGKYRRRIILKCKNTSGFRAFISNLLINMNSYPEFSKVSVYPDMNGDLGV